MTFKSPIGIDDFKKLIENDYTYVDKTLLIEEVLTNPGNVQLLLRPRRFGKTLNMSTLGHFFDCRNNNRHLFKGLAIEERPCFEKCGKHPTIFLSFKGLNASNYPDFLIRYRNMIMDLYADHEYLLEHMSPLRQKAFLRYAEGTDEAPTLQDALKWLSQRLKEYHGAGVILLIDEYDSPIIEGYNQDYYKDVIGFMREALSAALKTNPALEKGVLTGILRVSKESIFSGLNHVQIYTVKNDAFADKFGFTQAETLSLLEQLGLSNKKQEVQDWYNGYQIGPHTIYNPWSLLQFIHDPKHFRPYWLNTSSNTLVHELLLKADDKTQETLAKLMAGKLITEQAEDQTSFRDLNGNALWTLLLYSGYLTCEEVFTQNDLDYQKLRIPNREVMSLFKKTFVQFFEKDMGKHGIPDMLKSLTTGRIDRFGMKLSELVATVFSYYDTAGATPERVYHAFVLGLLSHISDSYHIRSNRESGFGRYDVMMIPKDTTQAGFVFEFKATDRPEDLEEALEAGLQQIRSQNYTAELKAQGIQNITEIAVAFCGKEVRVRKAQ